MGQDARLSGAELSSLVAAARGRDEAAWNALVAGLQRLVWKAVNMATSDSGIREDAFAATWLRLAERIDTIREPDKLPGWLATTAVNEVRQIVRQRAHLDLSLSASVAGDDTVELLDTLVGDQGDRAGELADADQRRHVRSAFERLDDHCRALIAVLVLSDPPISYDEASERLGRPVGSLGPTRSRCLTKLKSLLDHETGSEPHG